MNKVWEAEGTFVEYALQADCTEDNRIHYGFFSDNDNHEMAINKAATDVVNTPSVPQWTLSRIVRDEDPELHDAQDEVGEFHLVEVAKFDRAVGIIYTDL